VNKIEKGNTNHNFKKIITSAPIEDTTNPSFKERREAKLILYDY
jgi:hypothetical protein